MPPFVLSHRERKALEDLVAHLHDARTLRRVQALLWLDEGESAQEVADRLRVSRQAIYKWIAHFQARRALPIVARVATGERGGRPRTVQGIIDPLIAAVIDRDPRELGYRATVWTAPLLARYLQEIHHLTVSRPSVSLALTRLRTGWKRPRQHSSRRSLSWRQAKEGSNAARSHPSAR